MDENAKMLKIQ